MRRRSLLSKRSSTWYVRPSGGSYGTEAGTSYANAWDGFTNIDWTASGVKVGDTLIVAGTHIEILTVGNSGVIISGDYSGDDGIIDAEDTRGLCMVIADKTGVEVNDITLQNSTFTCLDISGASTVTTTNLVIDGSGNQGIQHEGTSVTTHNNLTGSNCLDEVFSGHDSSITYVIGGTFTDNATVVNNVQNSEVYISGNCTFTNNTQDIQGNAYTEASGQTFTGIVQASIGDVVLNDCTTGELYSVNSPSLITANDCIVGDVDIRATSQIVLNDCTLADTGSIAGGFLTINRGSTGKILTTASGGAVVIGNDAVIGNIDLNAGTTMTLNQCILLAATDISGSLTLDGSRVGFALLVRNNGTLTSLRSLFTEAIRSLNGGTIDIQYSIFYKATVAGFMITMDAGSTISEFSNNTCIVPAKTILRSLIVGISTTENNIFLDSNGVFSSTGGGYNSDFNCRFNINLADVGTVNTTNEITTDPVIANAATLDFSLGVGSSCIGTGKTLTVTTGIDTADWGDGSTTVPVVTTKEQAVAWDLGAYIS